MKSEALRILKEYYGYDNFREGQEKIIDAILQKRNVLGIMTTGAGKSICYQVPALVFKGLTIVISPLISLMKDQVDSLKLIGIDASYLNSTLTSDEYNKILFKIKKGQTKLLYISPERLENKAFLNFIKTIKIAMVVVDEAHCVSQWGENFRRSYLRIADFVKYITGKSQIQTLAFTATATPKIKVDIIEKLNIVDPFIYVDYFNRDNIYFKVVDNSGIDKDLELDSKPFIKDYLKKHKGKSGIIYCSTRKNVDDIYNYLISLNRSVTKYHGGMSKEERDRNQKLFLDDDVEIMVATNAFGMGINKSNIRYVIHANIPADLESYYQEAGRAGRDGGPAEAILIYNEKDIAIQRFLIEKESHDKEDENYKNKEKKFNKMLEYAELKTCYREYILKYFGEKMIRNYCGYCENCKKEKNIKDFSLEAKKIISGVGRAKESLGISTLANMLMGKADTKMLNKGLDKISTFGIMREDKQEWIESFINYMISEKYLIQSAGSFPVLKLGKKYKDILNGNIKVIRKENEKIDFDYYENNLFKELNSLRKEISKQENIAPYIIFSDMTLIEMAEKKPRTRWDMLKIKGIGNQKFKSYGARFLERINNYCMEARL